MPTPIDVFQNDPSAEPFKAGQTLFAQGDPGDHMYVVIAGEVDLKIGHTVIETVGSGGIFGEMALIDHRDRSASAIGKSDGTVVTVNQKRFLYLVQNTPFFAVQVMETMADRLRRMDEVTMAAPAAPNAPAAPASASPAPSPAPAPPAA